MLWALATGLLATWLAGPPAHAATTIKFGHYLSADSALHKGALEFARQVAARSKGELEVQVFPNSQLGSLREMPGALKSGTLGVTFFDYGFLAVVRRGGDFNILVAPFVFRDARHLTAFFKSPLWAGIVEDFNKAGVGFRVFAHFGDRGPRQISTKSAAVRTPADLKGVKLRVAPIPMHLDIFKAWGATPTPVDFSELFSALQQGVVEGQDNGVDTVRQMKFYEVQKNMILLEHARSGVGLAVSDKVWEGLTPAQRTVLEEAGAEAGLAQTRAYLEEEKTDLDTLRAKGMTIITPDREAFRKVSEPILKEWDASGKFWRKGLLKEVRGIK
jgi:tripartite ATP-independent transporter DctP family solute receptor